MEDLTDIRESQTQIAPADTSAGKTLGSAHTIHAMPNPPGHSVQSPAAQGSPSSAEHGLPEFVHEYLRTFINAADQKAGAVFAVAGAILAYLVSQNTLDLGRWDTRPIETVVGVLALGAWALTGGYGLLVVLPRGGDGRIAWRKTNDKRPVGYVYWDDILRHGSAQAYADAVRRLRSQDAEDVIGQHCYELASINAGKYGAVSRATRSLFWATLLTLCFIGSWGVNDVMASKPSGTGASGAGTNSSPAPVVSGASSLAPATAGAPTGSSRTRNAQPVAPNSSGNPAANKQAAPQRP